MPKGDNGMETWNMVKHNMVTNSSNHRLCQQLYCEVLAIDTTHLVTEDDSVFLSVIMVRGAESIGEASIFPVTSLHRLGALMALYLLTIDFQGCRLPGLFITRIRGTKPSILMPLY